MKHQVTVYLDQLKKGADEAKIERREASGRIEHTDRLRYILMLELCDDIRIAYIRSQDTLTRQELDARNSANATPDFHDMATEKFNDSNWVPQTTPKGDLHSFFKEPIVCMKKDTYTLTREKSKQLLLDIKHNVNDICTCYEKSGNGAGQLPSDDDSSNSEDGSSGVDNTVDDESNFGRFNKELARLQGGDDPHCFLKHQPVDLLYTWDVLDSLNLIHFTLTKLRGVNGVSSDVAASLTTYRALNGDDDAGPDRKKSKKDSNDDTMVMVSSELNFMNRSGAMDGIERLVDKKHKLMHEWRLEKRHNDYDSDEAGAYYKSIIAETDKLITSKEKFLEELQKNLRKNLNVEDESNA